MCLGLVGWSVADGLPTRSRRSDPDLFHGLRLVLVTLEGIMKLTYALAVLVASLVALPVSAQSWRVYDTFRGPFIDPVLWGGNGGVCPDALECERLIRDGRLWLRIRGHNRTDNSDGEVWSQNAVAVAEPAGVTGILARLVFARADGTLCPGVGSMVGQMGLRATFFHSQPGETPSSPEWLDEVEANLYMYPHPDGTADVGGILRRMGTPDAAWSETLGLVRLGQVVDIWLRWDEAAQTIYYGMQPLRQPRVEVPVDYSELFPIRQPSTNPYRIVQLQTSPHNCAGVRLYSDVQVRIDRVSVIP